MAFLVGISWQDQTCYTSFKGTGGSADQKISESALLSLNHHNVSNTELI